MTASNTFGVYGIVQRAAAAVELFYVDAGMMYIQLATAVLVLCIYCDGSFLRSSIY